MRTLASLFLLLALGVAAAPTAHAQGRRRILAPGVDPALRLALEATFEPLGGVVIVLGEPPPTTMPEAHREARARTDGAAAVALLWIQDSPSGAALWLYDHARDRLHTRVLPVGPPFDGGRAAQVALLARGLLGLDPPGRTARGPSAPLVLPQDRWTLEVFSGGSIGATQPVRAGLRFGLGVALWPAPFADRMGFALRVSSGTGVGVSREGFTARWTPHRLEVALLSRLRFAEVVEVGAETSLFAQLGLLQGRADAPLERAYVDFGLAADATLTVPFVAPGLRLGLRGGVVVPFRVLRFEVDGATALATRRAAGRVLLAASLRIP